MHLFTSKLLAKRRQLVILHSNVLLTHRHRCVTTSFTMESSSLGLKNMCVLET